VVKPVQVIVEAYAGTKTVARLGHRHERPQRAHRERGHPMSAGVTGTVERFAGPGWALVPWDRGGQALTHPSDLAIEPPPTCRGL
jgi:hypothetical protein